MTTPDEARVEGTVEAALRKRLDDWFWSTSEFYAQPVGSQAWRNGLIGYLLRGPGSLAEAGIGPVAQARTEGTQAVVDAMERRASLPEHRVWTSQDLVLAARAAAAETRSE